MCTPVLFSCCISHPLHSLALASSKSFVLTSRHKTTRSPPPNARKSPLIEDHTLSASRPCRKLLAAVVVDGAKAERQGVAISTPSSDAVAAAAYPASSETAEIFAARATAAVQEIVPQRIEDLRASIRLKSGTTQQLLNF